MTDLGTRLARILDILQHANGITRAHAQEIVAQACGLSGRHVGTLASNNLRLREPSTATMDGLARLETLHAAAIKAYAAYRAVCRRGAA